VLMELFVDIWCCIALSLRPSEYCRVEISGVEASGFLDLRLEVTSAYLNVQHAILTDIDIDYMQD
jgi:hypothetical protein